MAGYKAGTVFVDVVPSMKGFFKTVGDQSKANMPRAGADAGRQFADAMRSQVASSGKEVAAALSDPLGKSVQRLEAEASQAGRALSLATDQATAAASRLAAARADEARAAQAASDAEAELNRLRDSGSATVDQVSAAEASYARALAASKAANEKADAAATAHSRALGAQEEALHGADRATGALASATGRTKAEVAQATPALHGLASAYDDVEDSAAATTRATESTAGGIGGIAGIVRGALGPVMALGAAVGIGGFASEAIEASDATDKFKTTLDFAGLGTDEIDRLTASAQAYADATVYDLSDIQSITAQLAANNVKDFDRLAEAAGNLNAAVGGDKDTYKSMGSVLTQTASAGKLTTENWLQLAGAIPGASGRLKQALYDAGAVQGDWNQALSDGQVTAEEFNQAIMSLGFEDASVEAAKSTKTIEGAAGNLQATIMGGVKDLIDYLKPTITGVMGWLSDTIGKAVEWVKEHKDLMIALAAGVGVAVAAFTGFKILTSVVQWIKATKLVTEGLNAVLRANPVGLVITAIGLVVAGLVLLYRKSETFRNLVDQVGQAVKDAWEGTIYPALQAAWGWISGTLVPAIQSFWSGTLWPILQQVGQVIADTWTGVIWPALQAAWGWISGTLVPAIQSFWSGTVQPVVQAIASFVQSAWTNVVWPTLQAVWTFITGGLVPIIQWLWSAVISPVVSMIGTAISVAWSAVIKPAFDAICWVVSNVLGPTFSWLWSNVISPVWGWISDKIGRVIGFITDTLFPALKRGIEAAGNGFKTFKDTVSTAMDKIKGAAAKPVNFVINTVYTGGIKKVFDSIASKVGLSVRLPAVSGISGYASGGQWTTMTPGYTPGKDVFHFYSPDGGGAIALSGGEGIIRPDALRALGGKAWLDAVNASRGRGLATVGDTGLDRGRVHFAEGGIWGKITHGVSSAVSWVKDAASAVADIVSDPLGAISNLVLAPAKSLLDTLGGSFWEQAMAKAPTLLFDGIKNVFKSKVDEAGLSGGAGLVGAARKAVAAAVPYVWGGSSVPPGLDCSGLVYWAAQQMGLGWPRLTAAGYQSGARALSASQAVPGDLLFWGNPAHHVAIYAGGGRMVEEPHEGLTAREIGIWGTPTYGRYGKYDAGGWLTPGLTHAVNHTGHPEAILTARQWADIHTLAKTNPEPTLDGLELALVLDTGERLDAHIETVSAGVLGRRRAVTGRSR